MPPSDVPSRLAHLDFSDDEALRKRVLFDLVLETFRSASAGPPEYALWVPGRLEIFGKHTDYGGGHTLVAPVARGFIAAARPRSDALVALHDASRREQFVIEAKGAGDPPGWRRYALTVVRRLAKNFPGAALGADIAFGSDLPPASGMSSSSALMVAIAATLVRLAGIEARPEWQANVVNPWDAAGYFACIENGMPFGSLAGDAGVGTHGGSEDHVAIICGRADHASAWTYVPPVPVAEVRVPEDWRFVIASSGVAARKTGGARDAYNNLALTVGALLQIWNTHEPPAPSLRAALASAPGAVERLRKQIAADASARALNLGERLEQFVNEDARVVEALRAMQQGDATAFGELSQASQDDAERLLRNQTAETVALVEIARGLGARAASSFGAGFGGSVWAMVGKDDAQSFPARWLAEYRPRFAGQEAATTFEARPGPPLTWIA